MATVHFGRLNGPAGFSRTVAIKRLHPNLAKDPEFVAMFLDEARLAARIRHPNVVQTLDVVASDGEIFLVMDYVQGESLSKLRVAAKKSGMVVDPRVAAGVLCGVLHGLHAAHQATSEQGEPLNIVHRDVSPQNVLVGVEGVPRVLDFGVAKAIGRAHTTREGQIKGKLAYMSPEQLQGSHVTRQADVYAAAVVAWETLTGQRLFSGDNAGAVVAAVLRGGVAPPSRIASHVPPAFDDVVMRGLNREPSKRYATARDMAAELERCAGVASNMEIGEWVDRLAGTELSKRATIMAAIEGSSPAGSVERVHVVVASALPDTPSATAPLIGHAEVLTQGAAGSLAGGSADSEPYSDTTRVTITPTFELPRRYRNRLALPMAGAGLALAGIVIAAARARFEQSHAELVESRGVLVGAATSPALVQQPGSTPKLADDRADGSPATTELAPGASVAQPVDMTVPQASRAVSHESPRAPSKQENAARQSIRPGAASSSPGLPSKAPPNCNPPYVVDSVGHHRYKPECI
jgi:serine/threonine-protein kinase